MFQKRGFRVIGRILALPFIIIEWLLEGELNWR